MAVLGVDGCKAGWVGVLLDDADRVDVIVAPTITDLVTPVTDLAVVGIDMPIGLPVAGLRSIEAAVRAELGRRRSSVFDVPPRAVFAADTHDEANEICHAATGRRISRQTYALRRKVLEVDAWVAAGPGVRVVEIHPELSFATLAGGPLPDSKRTWAGLEHRRRLLADAGIHLHGDLGLSGHSVAPDDVLDAAAVAWSARRVQRDEATSIAEPAGNMEPGRRAAIWF